MYVRRLVLSGFRSWLSADLTLEPGVTVFTGRNGQGKTNLLEALRYLSVLSSHRVSSDVPLVLEGQESAKIAATAVNRGRELTAGIEINPGRANQAWIDGTSQRSARQLLGIVHTVLFAPEDLALVRGEPSERRRFIDEVMIVLRPSLGGVRADYDKVLRQRNALLKSASSALRRGYNAGDGADALATLDVWDAQLSRWGAQLVRGRWAVLERLRPLLTEVYGEVAPESRTATASYRATIAVGPDDYADAEVIEAIMLDALAKSRSQDIERGTSLVGPHRDDVELFLGSQPAKGYASHGETWSLVLALRWSCFRLFTAEGVEPILLLDDVFAELDAKRREALVRLAQEVEQVLITAAVREDIPEQLRGTVHTVTALPADITRHSVLDYRADREDEGLRPVMSDLPDTVDTSDMSGISDTAGEAHGG